MIGQSNHQAFLIQVSPVTSGSVPSRYPISADRATVIGRELDCQIVLNSNQYQGVSRKHLEIRPIVSSPNSLPLWQVCDLGSSNGTFINAQPLHGCQTLKMGDRIILGHNGPEFRFECPVVYPSPVDRSIDDRQNIRSNFPQNASQSVDTSIHLSQILPILSTRSDARWKKLMLPGAVTVLFVVLMFNYVGSNSYVFLLLLGVFLALAGYYVIYQICGHHKPWWIIVATAIFTVVFNLTLFRFFAFPFRYILPGNIEHLSQLIQQGQAVSPFRWLIAMFFGAGLLEELTKALPIFGVEYLGKQFASPKRERIGIWEPLDGILIGSASALGFTLDETLTQYVPMAIQQGGVLSGLQLLIPRILGAIAVHIAYSGYLGYFIGLSVMKPSKRWQLLAIGYFTSAILHAFWNAANAFGTNPITDTVLQCVAGVLAYGFLIAAIIKARQISPDRSKNFATRFGSPNSF